MSYRSIVQGSMDKQKIKGMMGHEKLVTRLSKLKVSRVSYDHGQIKFQYDGRGHTFRVVQQPHVKWVGHWASKKLYVDDNVRYNKDIICMSIHEAVESYISRKYHLDRTYTSHFIATVVEKAFARTVHQNWDDYQMRTELIFREEQNRRKI